MNKEEFVFVKQKNQSRRVMALRKRRQTIIKYMDRPKSEHNTQFK